MRTKCRSIATFHRPIHSHWSLPLNAVVGLCSLKLSDHRTLFWQLVALHSFPFTQKIKVSRIAFERLLNLYERCAQLWGFLQNSKAASCKHFQYQNHRFRVFEAERSFKIVSNLKEQTKCLSWFFYQLKNKNIVKTISTCTESIFLLL